MAVTRMSDWMPFSATVSMRVLMYLVVSPMTCVSTDGGRTAASAAKIWRALRTVSMTSVPRFFTTVKVTAGRMLTRP